MRLDFIFNIKIKLYPVFKNSAQLLRASEGFHSKHTTGYSLLNYYTLLPHVDYSLCPETINLRLIFIAQCFNTDDCTLKCSHLMGRST